MTQIRQLLRVRGSFPRAASIAQRIADWFFNFLARPKGTDYDAPKQYREAAIVITFFAPLAAAFIVLVAMLVHPAAAQPPSCHATNLGMTACLGTKLCACTYDRGGIATGVPAGYRWDCGILRPSCGPSLDRPATLDPYAGPYPSALGIDKSHRSVTIEQTNTNVNRNSVLQKESPARELPGGWGRHGDPLPLLPRD